MLSVLSALLVCMVVELAVSTPLDDYVNRFDPNYSYEKIAEARGPGYTLYTINMTSQKWKTGESVHANISCGYKWKTHTPMPQYQLWL